VFGTTGLVFGRLCTSRKVRDGGYVARSIVVAYAFAKLAAAR
jgi:hypothetical protein